MPREARLVVWVALAAALVPASVAAHEALFLQLPRRGDFARIFPLGDAYARVEDGLLLGDGRERTERTDRGLLRFTRYKTYRHVRHPDNRRVLPLSPPWRVKSTVELTSSLRLLRDHTELVVHDPGDEAVRDHFDHLFDFTESRTEADANGSRLARMLRKDGRVVEQDRYDYPQDAVPIEIVGPVLAFALAQRVDRFEFDLLLPGGSTHGVEGTVHRGGSVARFAKGYRVPVAEVDRQGPLAVVDLRLSSPIKYLFYPHHFYLAYSAAEPGKLIALWGGGPDESLQAFRRQRP